MDPQGPSQPPLDTVYNTAGNPADQNPQEQRTASVNENSNVGSLVEAREQGDVPVPSNHDQAATSTSLGYGARDSSGDKGSSISQGVSGTEGDQMRPPGEGDVYEQQFKKTGFGEQKDLASDLDRKKAEQSGMREQVKQQRESNVDVGGALGQRGGPAVPSYLNDGNK
ncbi:MAG: hypothetical protein LQ340_002002 [Diploschistes diacapsis]|nr:MAG: hypothetical protein LQ340_002002 [Diploschistes diacapsis]